MNRKILIKPSPNFGIFEVILFERVRFLFLRYWKEVMVGQFEEEMAFLVFTELIEKYEIDPTDIYDWSGDGFNVSKKKHKVPSKKVTLAYSYTGY